MRQGEVEEWVRGGRPPESGRTVLLGRGRSGYSDSWLEMLHLRVPQVQI